MSDFFIYGLVGLMAYQTYVTVRVVVSNSFTREEKWRQLLLVWLVPFVGAAITLSVLGTDRKPPVRPVEDQVPTKPDDRK